MWKSVEKDSQPAFTKANNGNIKNNVRSKLKANNKHTRMTYLTSFWLPLFTVTFHSTYAIQLFQQMRDKNKLK